MGGGDVHGYRVCNAAGDGYEQHTCTPDGATPLCDPKTRKCVQCVGTGDCVLWMTRAVADRNRSQCLATECSSNVCSAVHNAPDGKECAYYGGANPSPFGDPSVCTSGHCTPKAGGSCATDGACPPGSKCVAGQCVNFCMGADC